RGTSATSKSPPDCASNPSPNINKFSPHWNNLRTEGRPHERISQTCPGRWHHLCRHHLRNNRYRLWAIGLRHHHDRLSAQPDEPSQCTHANGIYLPTHR